MEIVIALILIGLGSAAIVVGRDGRVLVGGLGVQWLGVAWATLTMGGHIATSVGEGLAAIVCVTIMWLTLKDVDEMLPDHVASLDSAQVARLKRAELRARRRRLAQMGAVDQLWPLVIVLAGGMAGFALSRLYPLGGDVGDLLAFYWVALSGLLALVIDGAREPMKLTVGLFALLNGAFLLVNTLGLANTGDPVTAGFMAACRVGLAAILAYGWALLKATYNEVDLTPLFDSRSDAQLENTQTAMVASIEQGDTEPGDTESGGDE